MTKFAKNDSNVFLGFDVGTSSVRSVALDSSSKTIIGSSVCSLEIHHPKKDHYEQSSNQIWDACCNCVLDLLKRKVFNANSVKGIGFDATASLVVLDEQGNGLPVSETVETATTKTYEYDVIMWMDLRAVSEAEDITKAKHPSLIHVGNTMSPGMQPPKLLWLKKKKPHIWKRATHFLDLADFLTFRATGSTTRSLCCVGCKWLFKTTKGNQGWDFDFYNSIGLSDVLTNAFSTSSSKVQCPGSPAAHGLCQAAAHDLGLTSGISVATGSIDAHCGVVGALSTVPLTCKISIPPINPRGNLPPSPRKKKAKAPRKNKAKAANYPGG